MISGISGKIDIVTDQGLVKGTISGDSSVDFSAMSLKLTCGDFFVEIPLDTLTIEDDFIYRPLIKFKVILDQIKEHPKEIVRLIVEDSFAKSVLDSAQILDLGGEIERIDDDGNVFGWALHKSVTAPSLEIWVGVNPACTMLADRYCKHMSVGTIPSFAGFRGRIPLAILKTTSLEDIITLRDLSSGKSLFSAPYRTLKSGLETSLSPNSPVDVLMQPDFSAIYDAEGVNEFLHNSDPELFVETAYAYVLERRSDHSGLADLVARMKSGRDNARSILMAMYYSDERKAKGGFLGPFVGEPGYPFMVLREGRVGSDEEARLKTTYSDLNNVVLISDVRSLSKKRDLLEVENDLLEHKKLKYLNEIDRLVSTKEVVKLEILANAGKHSSGPAALPHCLTFGRIQVSWGFGSLRLRVVRPNRKSDWLRLADEARDQRAWSDACELYRKVLNEDPDNAPIWVQYGHAVKESGRVEEAEIAYSRAISIDSSSSDAHLQRGHALKLLGRSAEAEAEYLKAVALNPGAIPANSELVSLGWSQNEILAIR